MFNFIKNFIVKTVKFALGITALLVAVVVIAVMTDDGTSPADNKAKIKELTQPNKEVKVAEVKEQSVQKVYVLANQTDMVQTCVDTLGNGTLKNKSIQWKIGACTSNFQYAK